MRRRKEKKQQQWRDDIERLENFGAWVASDAKPPLPQLPTETGRAWGIPGEIMMSVHDTEFVLVCNTMDPFKRNARAILYGAPDGPRFLHDQLLYFIDKAQSTADAVKQQNQLQLAGFGA